MPLGGFRGKRDSQKIIIWAEGREKKTQKFILEGKKERDAMTASGGAEGGGGRWEEQNPIRGNPGREASGESRVDLFWP